MRSMQNLDLKNKLILLAAVSGAMALLMACAGFVWHDLRLLRSVQIEELRAKAELLAITGAQTITHEQPHAMNSLMEVMKTHPAVAMVCIFDLRGEVLASIPSSPDHFRKIIFPINRNSHRYAKSGELELFHPIMERGHDIGIVYLKANMQEFREQVYSHATMIVALTLCSLAVALVFASMMQSLISKPILRLADVARRITSNEDYTIRVQSDSHDELGILYDSFNQMVQKIQVSQSELKQARNEMEERVVQRTQQLQDEIERRAQVQQELVRAKEAAEAANKAKSRFLANMSHEIRTPLNGILGFTDYVLMYDNSLSEADRRDYLRIIKTSGESLLVLINDILDLSKIEAEKMDFERIRFSPHSVFAEVNSILRPKAQEKQLSFRYRWESDVPESIESDPVRFRQLLINLIGNAIKFSEVGGIDVVARLERADRKLIVSVIDTGVGIPPQTQRTLFTPFTQGDSSVTRRFGGTGLGLSICKRIAEGLGGEIHFSSEQGCGSIFTFTIDTGALEGVSCSSLPMDVVTREPARVTPLFGLLSRRILVAEDGETNRKLIQLLLERTGADVVLVEDGLAAVQEARQSKFDLILLDMQMPVMDGYSAAQKLRAEGYQGPIVALTANSMRGDEERCLAAGCTEYIAKPVRQEKLLTRIVALIGGRLHDNESTAELASDLMRESFENMKDNNGCYVSELPIEELAFAELVTEFIRRAEENLQELRRAHESRDDEKFARLAHWMKGSGGMAGFPIVTDYARRLEKSAQASDYAAIESQLEDLEELIGKLQSPTLASV